MTRVWWLRRKADALLAKAKRYRGEHVILVRQGFGPQVTHVPLVIAARLVAKATTLTWKADELEASACQRS
jgi:hypothetical protein